MQKIIIGVARFDNTTWLENKNYREASKYPCIYGFDKKISETVPYGRSVFVIEMNNSTNEIMGIGKIKNILNLRALIKIQIVRPGPEKLKHHTVRFRHQYLCLLELMERLKLSRQVHWLICMQRLYLVILIIFIYSQARELYQKLEACINLWAGMDRSLPIQGGFRSLACRDLIALMNMEFLFAILEMDGQLS